MVRKVIRTTSNDICKLGVLLILRDDTCLGNKQQVVGYYHVMPQ